MASAINITSSLIRKEFISITSPLMHKGELKGV